MIHKSLEPARNGARGEPGTGFASFPSMKHRAGSRLLREVITPAPVDPIRRDLAVSLVITAATLFAGVVLGVWIG